MKTFKIEVREATIGHSGARNKIELSFDDLFDTEDEAYIKFYKDKTKSLEIVFSKITEDLSKIKKERDELERKFSYLKEKFPEKFI